MLQRPNSMRYLHIGRKQSVRSIRPLQQAPVTYIRHI